MAERHINPWIVAISVMSATFLEVLDTTIVNVSLPHIAGSLSASIEESTWVLTSYLVSNAVVLPLSGWMASRFGRKRFYMSCVALFTLSSMLCGLAPTFGSLLQLALSRRREYDADLEGAELTGDPRGLASARPLRRVGSLRHPSLWES